MMKANLKRKNNDFEKLGLFYLGKEINSQEPLLFDSKNLTTHAVCLGMTGSGKTGLGVILLEEAAIDGIPSIVIDPKGDLGNLLLSFPNQTKEEFLPWIDEGEAERAGMTKEAYAAQTAKNWKEGLTKWGQDQERILRFKSAIDVAIYTPASDAGIPISILNSFAVPEDEILNDSGALRERVLTITSSLLGLVGIDADPIKSREHILLSTLINNAWKEKVNLDLATLIRQIQNPPFSKIGALDLETFIPSKERISLSVALNGLLASPGFQSWMEGEPLDIQNLLYTNAGKPRISILSIAHLTESERMFFVTLLLNELVSWTRKQPGTSSLKALFYMDEIFGYFPPVAMPPSKLPMLTLLKQARAYGLGIILSTQNPVDLDYKGLANCGTWFIGKLQTERDRARVAEGLSSASNGEINSRTLNKLLASTGKRMFILQSIHEKEPMIFETRWALSYLRGPMTLAQISKLNPQKTKVQKKPLKQPKPTEKPEIPAHLEEYFYNKAATTTYQPQAGGFAKIHYVNEKYDIDYWKEVILAAPVNKIIAWKKGEELEQSKLQTTPKPESSFEEIPQILFEKGIEKEFKQFLYEEFPLLIFYYPPLKLFSTPSENERDFRVRVSQALREARDKQLQEVEEKHRKKIESLNDKLARYREKVEEQESQAGIQKAQTYINIGTGILGALFGKRITRGSITHAGTTMRGWGRMQKEKQEAERAQKEYIEIQQQIEQLKDELELEAANFENQIAPSDLALETAEVRPRKSDIIIEKVALIWVTI